MRHEDRSHALKDKLLKEGIEAVASTPAELEAFMRADVAKRKNVVQTARIRAD